MEGKKYSVSSTGPKIEAFLKTIKKNGGFAFDFKIGEAENFHPDLANKAELLLALELLTMEMLRMSGEEHSLLQFDAHDYRALRIEELRLSAVTAAEKVKKTKIPFEFS